MDIQRFARWFRASSPYIRAHRNKRFVILLPHECTAHQQFDNIVRDLALLHVLEIKLILVIEPPPGLESEQTKALAETTNALHTKFARGLPSSRYRNQHIPLTHANFVAKANKRSRHDGTDWDPTLSHCFQTEELQCAIENDDVLVVTPQVSGSENLVPVDDLVASLAQAIDADKLLVLDEIAGIADDNEDINSDMTVEAFAELVDKNKLTGATDLRLRSLLYACRHGVSRGHIVSFATEGALLAELFTADGSGIQISQDDYLTIRQATPDDLDAITELMRADINEDRIVPRTRNKLADQNTTLYVAEHDKSPVGCVALYSLTDGMQEIGTLIADQKHRDRNIGSRLLRRAEKEAKRRQATHVYVFSKHTSDWFIQHDYRLANIDQLPQTEREQYDRNRQSMLLIKELS